MSTKRIASLAVGSFTFCGVPYDVVVYHTRYGNQGVVEGSVYACITDTDQNEKKYEGKASGGGYDKWAAAIELALKKLIEENEVILSRASIAKESDRIRKRLTLVF